MRVLAAILLLTFLPIPAAAADASDRTDGRAFPVLALAGLASAITWQLDERDTFAEELSRGSLAGLIDFGNTWGDGRVIGGGVLGVMALGTGLRDDGLEALGADLTRSFALSSALTLSLKGVIDRRRPSGGRFSFPSGHTSAAFCVVPALHRHVGWAASAPAAALGVITALGRMQDEHHYLSDVIFGAALGWTAGDLATRFMTRRGLRGGPGSGNVFLGPGAAGYSASF